MSISTSRKCESATTNVKVCNSKYIPQTFSQSKTQIESFEQNSIKVYLSDAEVQVILSKAQKAGISLNEYMRHAALGFPIP